MIERKDLTRWNRACLTRFRYVDGNAVEYLDIMRELLVEQFGDRKTKRCEWLNPAEKIPANEEEPEDETETLTQRQERLSRKQQRILEIYHQDRRDWAWEITRIFARACHILTEHTNAYANEGYLGTATQWDHVRRLVEMLDYHPAPPASASTRLVLVAKENKLGIVAKGFQVKHSPANGGPKVVFETLEDLLIDPALNELRLKGWDQSDEPALPTNNNGTTQPPAEEQLFSFVAQGQVINIQGVEQVSASKLNTLADDDVFLIKDFINLEPDNSGLEIEATWLWEWKAKADILVNFAPEGNWSVIAEWLLPDIAEASAESLAERSGNSLDMAAALKQDIEIIEICLDSGVYEQTQFKDLFAPVAAVVGTVVTSWYAKRIPKVVSGEVAMVMDESNNVAEAVKIDSVKEISAEETLLDIHLLPSPVQYTWRTWPKSKTTFHFSPRWQRKCWLNGSNVIRTKEPHGLTTGAFVGWQHGGRWKFAEVKEADKRNLRLMLTGSLPDPATQLYEARPLKGPNLPAEIEEVGLVDEELPADAIEGMTAARLVDQETPEFPNVISTGPTESDDPLSLIPSIFGKLPEVGSFIVPSPMLPMDLVKAAVKILLKIGAMVIPSTGEPVFEFVPPADLADTIYDLVDDSDSVKWENENEAVVKSAIKAALNLPGGTEPVFFKIVKQVYLNKGPFLVVPKHPQIKAIVETSNPRYIFDGSADKIESGDWVVGEFTDGLRALKISAIKEFTSGDSSETFSLSFENLLGNVGELKNVYADFRGDLVAEGAAVNDQPVDLDNIELEEEAPESLKIGRKVLLTSAGKEPVAVKIESIDGNTITTNPPAIDFTKGNLIILGNVVDAGHGAVMPEKILGSGNASKSNQEFTLEVEEVSFTPDATKSSGVAAAIEVEVAGRLWEQVSTLKDSAPGDHHYAIRMTEEGYVKILFGDGVYGRRLPTGKNNIRVRYRVGSGLAGNVPVGGLEKPVSPHPLIKAVLQPLPAAGGGDMEDVASLRKNAPATLLALERAVSLSDFIHLAAAQSSVWQAKATSQILHGGRTESVRVVIVPAGGVESLEINETIRSFLQKHALPGVQVTVDDCVKKRFNLSITVRVITDEFIAEEVERAVTSALEDHFILKNRKLGEHLYLSEVYKVVERVQGVENSICVLNDDNSLQLIRADNESTVVYLDTDADENPSTLTVDSEEYLS